MFATRFSIPLALVAVAIAPACGPTDPADAMGIDDSSEALGTQVQSFVVLRADTRRCMAPLCGGTFVHDVNRAMLREEYVSGLDFSRSGLDATAIDKVRSAPADELVLRGRLGPPDARFGTRAFLVTEAYRGMPGVSVRQGSLFYKAWDRDPQIHCLAAPCDNEIARRLNTGSETAFTSLDVNGAARTGVSRDWLAGRVVRRGAVVAGAIVDGRVWAGGPEQVLVASQVFVRLPDVAGPCPMSLERLCTGGTIGTYTRTADRCLVFDRCVAPAMCYGIALACDDGYRKVSWAAGSGGCPVFACEPEFVYGS